MQVLSSTWCGRWSVRWPIPVSKAWVSPCPRGDWQGRARKLSLRDAVEYRHEANQLLTRPGDAVLVKRGVARAIALACPDGCGEQLTINLDHRAGPAWRHYVDDAALSIYPSIRRDTGCKSHFIVWRSKIYWCNWNVVPSALQARNR